MPSFLNVSSMKSAAPSLPTLLMKAVWAPERTAAIAWLAPLPPPATARPSIAKVSPGCGKR